MSRQVYLTPASRWWLDERELAERGYKRCGSCAQLVPLTVSRCRRRTCPSYSAIWARDTMPKTGENLNVYGGLVAMTTVKAPRGGVRPGVGSIPLPGSGARAL